MVRKMKKYLIISAFIFNVIVNSFAQQNASFEWEFDDDYKKTRIFVHAFVNYDFSPSWQIEWEKNLIKKNGLKIDFGSTTVKDLYNEIELVLNVDIGKDWWFRSSFYRDQSQYKDENEEHNYIGFERRIYRNLSIYSLCNTYYDKEEIDIDLGFSIMDSTSEKYCRITLSYDDFLYDEKNQKGGKVTEEPLGVNWAIRYGLNKLWFFTEGKYTNCSEIEYNNPELSPEIYLRQHQINNLVAKMYYFFKEDCFSELRIRHYHFFKKELYYQTEYSYSYLNEIYDIACKYQHQLNSEISIRPVLHYIIQNAVANGYKTYDFKRRELIPSIIMEYTLSNSVWEFGFLCSRYRLDYDDIDNLDDYETLNSDIKFMIRWTYNFSKNARLQFSLSHVPEIEGFGGGNLHYMMFF